MGIFITRSENQIMDVSHSLYSKLISKQAYKLNSDSYKCKFPWGKFLFNRPRSLYNIFVN